MGTLRVRYQVDWTGAGNLWVDKIRAHEWDPDLRRSLMLFRGEYDPAISDTLASYYGGTVDPPWRFYLYDEPRWELDESLAYMDALIKAQTGGTPGVSAVNLRHDNPATHQRLLRDYIDTVEPGELLVDYYPFHHTVPDTSHADYARRARDRLNRLTYWYGNAREVTLEKSVPLWAVIQAHSWPNNMRNPTREEIRAQVNLALAHGATG
ncbi:MAG: hypothetical protein OXH11_04670, partial [Candidatus Aminicenantes bacterium]|nr:hypothetical protein [Candidatus Aminicenantes bacterium]